jgi:glucokinase
VPARAAPEITESSTVSRFAVGVDLGGTNLRIAAVDESGKLFEKISQPVEMLAGRDAIIEALCRSVRSLAAEYRRNGEFVGAGVGVPGILYVETGTLRQSPNLAGWENFAVRDAIAAQLDGASVIVDNDANLAALGEKWLGAGRDVGSLCLLTLGTGVGGGLVLDGRVWRGFLGMAGEVGHIFVAENGVPCGCGSWGCLETEASATAIVRKAEEAIAADSSAALRKAQQDGSLSAHVVYELAHRGDAASCRIFQSVGRYLGLGIATLINTLNLPLYAIGGGVAEAWDLFAAAMFEELRKRSYIFAEGSTRVEKAQLGGDAGLYGAARLAFMADAF